MVQKKQYIAVIPTFIVQKRFMPVEEENILDFNGNQENT
jgi:hypothetical protein